MGAPVAYLDSSAIVKLVIRERKTRALVGELRPWRHVVSSVLCVTEVLRAVARVDIGALPRARRILASVSLYAITPSVLVDAAAIRPPKCRTLDAIHVATARRMGAVIGAVVTYDARMQAACDAHGLAWTAPSDDR